MVKVISTPGPKAIYIEKLKLAVLYKLDNHEIFPRLRGLFSSIFKMWLTFAIRPLFVQSWISYFCLFLRNSQTTKSMLNHKCTES